MGLFDDLVNDPRILCTFCAACHLVVAHSGDFHVENGQLATMLKKKCGYTGVYFATNFAALYLKEASSGKEKGKEEGLLK
jgi:hypothetical protein